MDAVDAKRIGIEVWTYLREHPEIKSKRDLPPYLFNKIKGMTGQCPLCELFKGLECAEKCPLFDCMHDNFGLFVGWRSAETPERRRQMAAGIVRKLNGWRAENYVKPEDRQ